MPRLDVQLRRDERRDRRTSAQSHPGNVAAENVIFPLINMVMTGVPRRRDRAHFQRTDADNVHVLQNPDALLGNRRELPPELFHFVAVNARGGVDEP